MSRARGLEHGAVFAGAAIESESDGVFLAPIWTGRVTSGSRELFLRKSDAANKTEGVFQRKSPAARARQGLESNVFDSHLFCDPPLDVFAALTFFWGEVTRQGQRRTQRAACGTSSAAQS